MLEKNKIVAASLAIVMMLAFAGCSKKQGQTQQVVPVKSMQVIKRDTPITYEYTGFIEAANDVQVKSKVTGMIVEKLVNGGDYVEAGQLLYVIDPRNYQNSLLSAQAQLANVQANLANVRKDVGRYETLYKQGAISRQALDNYTTQLSQAEAQVRSQEALVAAAQVDVGETRIVAPFSGKIDTNALSEGTFVTAGATVLTSISNSDPMRVKFSIAEGDYLKLAKAANGQSATGLNNMHITLADGKEYQYPGTISQVDRGVGEGTGTLTLKADFPNPEGILLPGMFAHITVNADVVKNAVLVPQRAVSEIMYKKFVTVIDKDNKVMQKEVKLGARVGKLWLVETGLDGTETIVVEGVQKVTNGAQVKAEQITEADLDTTDKSVVK